MALPICIEIPEIPDPFNLTLPGGIQIEHINLMEVIQPALTPLVPIFDIIDTVVAVFNCIKAIPDTLGPPPDPTAIAACLPDLAEKVAKLLKLIPQLSIPLTIIGLIDLVIDTLLRARSEIMHLQQQMQQILGVIDRATNLDDAGLMAIAQCAQANVAQEAANVGKSLAALASSSASSTCSWAWWAGPRSRTCRTSRAGRSTTWSRRSTPSWTRSRPHATRCRCRRRNAMNDHESQSRGLLVPFRRDKKRDFASDTGADLLGSKVLQALMTCGATPRSSGELPWRTAFGAGLDLLRQDEALAELARVQVRDALKRWVSEAELVEVSVSREDASLLLRVRFRPARRAGRGDEQPGEVTLAIEA